MASVTSPNDRSSPTIAAVYECPSHEVEVGLFFSWNDLSKSLHAYLERINEEYVGSDSLDEKVFSAFAKELEVWLKDPASAKGDPLESLQSWQEKVRKMIEDYSLSDFPEIEIKKE